MAGVAAKVRTGSIGPVQELPVELHRLMVFVGPNDSGKTTVLRALASALAPTVSGTRQGRWAPQATMAAEVRAALGLPEPDGAEDQDMWIQGPSSKEPPGGVLPGQASVVTTENDGHEGFHPILMILGPGVRRPVDEVVWIEVPRVSALSRALRARADTTVVAVSAYDLLPEFVKERYKAVVIGGGAGMGIALQDKRAEHKLEVLASGVKTWLLLALAEALRRSRRRQWADRSVLFLVDEPELHLHPLGQQAAAAWLMKLLDGSGPGALMAVATHSASVVEMALRRSDSSVTVCSRKAAEFTTIDAWSGPELGEMTKRAEAAGLLASEMYLSAGVLLVVEGTHELNLLPAIWRLLFGRLPGADGVRLAAGAGLDNMAVLLAQMASIWDPSKPRFVLADCDGRSNYAFTRAATKHGFTLLTHDRFDIVACVTAAAYRKAGCWNLSSSTWEDFEAELAATHDRKVRKNRRESAKKSASGAMAKLIDYLDSQPQFDLYSELVDPSLCACLHQVRTAAQPT